MTTQKNLPNTTSTLTLAFLLCVGIALAFAPIGIVSGDGHLASEKGEHAEGDGHDHGHDHGGHAEHAGHAHEGSTSKALPGGLRAQCILNPTEGNKARGIITFTDVEGGVQISGVVTGLNPDAKHGFHIHQFGDISSPDGKATGGHYNPHGTDHAGPDDDARHVGDLGNIVTSDKGIGTYDRIIKGAQVGGEHSILGRGMIIHAGTDDLTSQPTGAAGGRIAQGIIAVIKSE
jgi:Cu-Zn family superoxide dismutase